jgi:hypothetical protein
MTRLTGPRFGGRRQPPVQTNFEGYAVAKGPGSSPWDAGGRLADLGDGNGDWEVVAESVLIDRWPCCRTELASGVDTALTVDGSLVDDERFSNSQTLSRSGPGVVHRGDHRSKLADLARADDRDHLIDPAHCCGLLQVSGSPDGERRVDEPVDRRAAAVMPRTVS